MFYSTPFRLEIGNTIDVALDGSEPYTSIQAAVNAAASGDTVLVHPGTYSEQIVLKSNIRVFGMDGTVVRPTAAGPAMRASGLVHRPTVDGIVFDGGSGSTQGALLVQNCGILLSNCEFTALTRAVTVINGHGDIIDCTFENNHDANAIGGGALWIDLGASGPELAVDGCRFEGNTAGAYAACVLISSESVYSETAPQVSFNNCEFIGNEAADDAAIRVGSYTRPSLTGCTFVGKIADAGGAIVGGTNAGAVFQNCTFAANVGNSPISLVGVSPLPGVTEAVSIDACILSHTTNGVAIDPSVGTQYQLSRSDFFGNASGDATWASQGQDCFSADPAYCGSGSYELYSFSPCLPGIAVPTLVGAHGFGCSAPASVELLAGLGGVAPDSLLFGCPGGDADSFVVHIDFDEGIVTRVPNPGEIVLAPPYSANGIWTSTAILAEPVASPELVTSLAWKYVSGTGVDSLEIQLNGHPLGAKPVLQRRGPDLDGNGVIGVADAAMFGANWPPHPYDIRSDFDGSGIIDVGDFAALGAHWEHRHPFAGGGLAMTVAQLSAATVGLRFEELDPLLRAHRTRAHLTIENAELFKAVVMAFESENPMFEFVDWHPNPSYPKVTVGTKTRWNGKNIIMIGALGAKDRQTSFVNLGYFDLVVHSDDPMEPSEDDFKLVIGDVLEMGGGVLTVPASSARRTYSAPVYRNHLAQNYPNPFNPSTTIAFTLENKTQASLVIYDVRGARVRTLVDGARERGNHRIAWNGENDRGARVASGVYFYRITAGSFQSSRKMVLLR